MINMKLRVYPRSLLRSGTRVLMRIDANVPLLRGKVDPSGDARLKAVLPEIEVMLEKGVQLTLMTHLGRPGGVFDPAASVAPIAEYLKRALKHPVPLCTVDEVCDEPISLLENLRFDSGEEKDSAAFAKRLAKHGDVYINNAFGVCHRKHASVHAITRYLPSYAGRALQTEVKELSRHYRHPAVLVVGGIKLESKVAVIEHLAPSVDAILTAGGVAVALIEAATGKKLFAGGRKIEKSELEAAKRVFAKHRHKLHVPIDFQVANSAPFKTLKTARIEEIEAGKHLFDIGPLTAEHYAELLEGAKSIVWNGPMGQVERAQAAKGTIRVAQAIAKNHAARAIVGGGDTVTFLEQKRLCSLFSFVSTGGGAMLAFLAGETMPGIEVLKR